MAGTIYMLRDTFSRKLVTDPRVSLVSLVQHGLVAFASIWLPEPGLRPNMVELLQSLSAVSRQKSYPQNG